jgi:hypothetical protein
LRLERLNVLPPLDSSTRDSYCCHDVAGNSLADTPNESHVLKQEASFPCNSSPF